MKKLLLMIALALFSLVVLGQEQEQSPVLPDEQQTQAVEQPAAPSPVLVQGRDLKRFRFPKAFIHAGKEYQAGDYWLVLTAVNGQPAFSFQDAARKEQLFEDLAVVIGRSGGRTGSGFQVSRLLMKDSEYFRIRVTTPGEWLFGYFLVKK
jgi:hypothetical protein